MSEEMNSQFLYVAERVTKQTHFTFFLMKRIDILAPDALTLLLQTCGGIQMCLTTKNVLNQAEPLQYSELSMVTPNMARYETIILLPNVIRQLILG